MKTINIKPNANGLTKIEDLTLAQLQVIQKALKTHFEKIRYQPYRFIEIEYEHTKQLIASTDKYLIEAAKRITEKQLIN